MTTLQLELENIKKLHKETVDNYRSEIEIAKETEKILRNEVRIKFLWFVKVYEIEGKAILLILNIKIT